MRGTDLDPGSGLGVPPQAPARLRARGQHRPIGHVGHHAAQTVALATIRGLGRVGDLGANLDEIAQADGRSICARLQRPARRGPEGGSGGVPGCPWGVERLPAFADFVAVQGASLAIQTAVADLRGDRSPEVAAGSTGGAGSMADPAPCRLCLGCRAVRTAPHRHGWMVAASGGRVDRCWLGWLGAPDRPAPREAGYDGLGAGWTVMTDWSWVDPN